MVIAALPSYVLPLLNVIPVPAVNALLTLVAVLALPLILPLIVWEKVATPVEAMDTASVSLVRILTTFADEVPITKSVLIEFK
jgi:hypothetical protein